MNTTYWVLICVASFGLGVFGGFRLTMYLASRALSKAMGALFNNDSKQRGFTVVEALLFVGAFALTALLGLLLRYLTL